MRSPFRGQALAVRQVRAMQRSGAVFAYFMVYVFIAGTTTAVAGMMLHVMFQARTADAKRADGIRQLLRIDEQLRSDWLSAAGYNVQPQTLTIDSINQTEIVYTIAADRIQRVTRNGEGDIEATNRFRFPIGTSFSFEESKALARDAGVIFRVTSPVLRQDSKVAAEGSSAGKKVEIFLASPFNNAESAGSEVSDEEQP